MGVVNYETWIALDRTMKFRKLRIAEKITISREAITNALNDAELMDSLTHYGYHPEKLREGLVIQEHVMAHQNNRVAEFGQRMEATQVANERYERVYRMYLADRQVVKGFLKPYPGLLEGMGVMGKIERRRDAFLFQVQVFYEELKDNEEIREHLSLYHFTPESLAIRIAEVEALAAAMHEQQHQSGLALVATERQREALAELEDWMIRFFGVARLAFRHDKKQLEKLGILR